MRKKDKVTLTDAITQYLQLKEMRDSQEAQMDGLKEVIKKIADAHPAEFVEGELLLDGIGLLKFVQNPAKLVYGATGKTLNEIETAGLVTELNKIGAGFGKMSINTTKLRNMVDAKNGAVLSLLNMNGLELVQSTRLDVKKA